MAPLLSCNLNSLMESLMSNLSLFIVDGLYFLFEKFQYFHVILYALKFLCGVSRFRILFKKLLFSFLKEVIILGTYRVLTIWGFVTSVLGSCLFALPFNLQTLIPMHSLHFYSVELPLDKCRNFLICLYFMPLTFSLLLFFFLFCKFPLAIYFTYGNVSFHVTLSIYLTLFPFISPSSPLLLMSISLFSMSVSPLLPCK